MSSLRRRRDWLELRLVAEHPESVTATLVGRFTEGRRADLLGNPGEPLASRDGEFALPMRPWEIATVQLLM